MLDGATDRWYGPKTCLTTAGKNQSEGLTERLSWMNIKALETGYAGHRFRSRLEARWAVFFTTLRMPWRYEPEGYSVGGQPYLPDFYLPDTGTWVEVKGDPAALDWDLLVACVDGSPALPGIENSWTNGARGLLVLGDIPEPHHLRRPHALLQHSKRGWLENCWFNGSNPWIGLDDPFDDNKPYIPPSFESPHWRGESDSTYGPGDQWVDWTLSMHCGKWWIPETTADPLVNLAYQKARAARFEHGEKG